MTDKISYQGEPGSFSHKACEEMVPKLEPMGCATFEDAFAAVEEGVAKLAMIPVENSVAGRVADIHHLLPESPLHIVAEHFSAVVYDLLVRPGTKLEDIRTVAAHPMGLAQCRKLIRSRKWRMLRELDNAGAARLVSEGAIPAEAALASALAGETYGLVSLQKAVQDDPNNTTRFLVLSRTPAATKPADGPFVTSFLFRVKNVPAALYKALGGFATNGVNMTKLESYQIDGRFTATQFYADVEGHPDDPPLKRALEELEFFAAELRVVGVYPQAEYRRAKTGQP